MEPKQKDNVPFVIKKILTVNDTSIIVSTKIIGYNRINSIANISLLNNSVSSIQRYIKYRTILSGIISGIKRSEYSVKVFIIDR